MRRSGTVFAWDDIDWYETIYDRHGRTIVDGNVWAGDTECWGGVTDFVVKKVVTDVSPVICTMGKVSVLVI